MVEFIELQKTFADSPKSWSVDVTGIDTVSYDLSVKNPDGGEVVVHRSPLILTPRGDYQTLLSYQKSEIAYQITYRFCERFLKRGDRTIDQMVQAARSGKQNIVEGSRQHQLQKRWRSS